MSLRKKLKKGKKFVQRVSPEKIPSQAVSRKKNSCKLKIPLSPITFLIVRPLNRSHYNMVMQDSCSLINLFQALVSCLLSLSLVSCLFLVSFSLLV